MKKTFISIAASFLVVSAFAQEKQVENAEKAFKNGNFNEAKTIIDKVIIEDANYFKIDPEIVSDYFFVKGNIYKALGERNKNNDELIEAVVAYDDLVIFEKGQYFKSKEKSSGDYEYFKNEADLDAALAAGTHKKKKIKDIRDYHTAEVKSAVTDLAEGFRLAALAAYEAEDYKGAREGFVNTYQAYQNPLIGRKDTVLLYNAGVLGMKEENYPASITIFEELLNMNYTGVQTVYEATSKTNGEKTQFATEKEMKQQIKFGVVENPNVYDTPNVQTELYKNIGDIYVVLGEQEKDSEAKAANFDKAIETYKAGRVKFPDNQALLLSLGNVYLKDGKQEEFVGAMKEAVQSDPTNETLYFNIGVINADLGMKEESLAAYDKAIELKPDYTDAYINAAVLILNREKEIVEEINNLPIKMRRADRTKLANLNKERDEVYNNAIGYLEGAYVNDETNVGLLQTMKEIYYKLGRDDDFLRVKKELEALEQ